MEFTRHTNSHNQRHDDPYTSYARSNSERRSVASPSVTPRNASTVGDDDNAFNFWFLDLSNNYSLQLRRPDPKVPVAQTGASVYYNDSLFYSRLKQVYRKGFGDLVLQTFEERARMIHSKWVKKPNGESDATPSLTDLPRASSESERASLLDQLALVLDFLSPGERPILSVENCPPSPSDMRRLKRSSPDEEPGPSPTSKRCRGFTSPLKSPSVLSRLDHGAVRASTPLSGSPVPLAVRDVRYSQQHDANGPSASVNTSKSSLALSVFSDAEDPQGSALPATQETETSVVAANSQKNLQPLLRHVPDSRAPETSFNEQHDLSQDATQFAANDTLPNASQFDLSFDSGDKSILQDDDIVDPIDMISPRKLESRNATHRMAFEKRLQDVWPTFPKSLQNAPLAVRWEIMRLALHCGTHMDDLRFLNEPIPNDQAGLWKFLGRLKAFEGRSFPEKSKPEAWKAAMSDHFRSVDQAVVFTASLAPNLAKDGPLFKLSLQPLRLDLPHRLDRRFGSDRFLELIIPSLHTKDMRAMRKYYELDVEDAIISWLVNEPHVLLGRVWRSFFIKSAAPKKMHKDDTLRPETITILQERIYLFAEDGNDFSRTEVMHAISPRSQANTARTKMKLEDVLDWLLQIKQNKKTRQQPVCKLFSRIALGLSRTHPSVVLQPNQIRHRDEDIKSPAGKVMNDGIARMSSSLARQIRDIMGLDDIPAAYQGRFGSAKGVWIRDAEDTSDEIWIETYPSQRKWICNFEEEDHRTFEVRGSSKELRSATLNLQLLPILEDRAIDASRMKEQVGQFMKDSLIAEMESQKEAMKNPAHFRLYVHENSAPQRRQDRVRLGRLPWACGLPISREDQMELLLSSGFDPTKLEFLRKNAFKLRKDKCEELQTRLNVKVGRSTYAYMVVDVKGVLEEGEVHLGFSSKFTDEQSGFSETFLHGMDILVARTPAHYPSDIQRVKAVFKPELGLLKDVIIFSTKGDIPLADKLSGGDYDGDIAWICWEPSIVNNFTNAPVPEVPDLFRDGVLRKVSETYEDLARSCRSNDVTTEWLDQAFRFNMESNLLGTCTNYKEKLCYSRNSVRDEHAIFLSTLISNLVDRPKQGIVFTERDWDQQRKILNAKQGDRRRAKGRLDPPQPQYKNNDWGGLGEPTHIIDYAKFVAGKPTVSRELEKLDRYLGQAEHYDKDLVTFYEYFEKFKRPRDLRMQEEAVGKIKKTTWETVLDELKRSIDEVATHWGDSRDEFEIKRDTAYDKWRSIKATHKVNSKTVQSLCETSLEGIGLSQWDLLKASYCFKMYYKRYPSFPWYMAGYQLAFLKSIAVSQGGEAPPVLLTPEMYVGSRPDAKFVRAVAALNDGRRFEQTNEEAEELVSLSDQDD
ncbi:hypothetical protein F4777DRAFT_296968 [Nemania sp. FL0916]|nr:hypothetical protein F4777DRAFT_296968 [Nemania sp. FL0916]